jgi:Protein of unknown function (DUF3011)
MKKSIIAFSILLTAGFAGSAFAGQVTCASDGGKYRECRLDGSGDIVMKQQLSKTNCTKNDTWGETANGVYVKGGCRAIFETMSMAPQKNYGNNAGNTSNGQVTCASDDGKYKECRLDGSGDIVMKQQLSKTNCTKDVNWGETANGVYVKGGCRAIFETMSMNQANYSSAGSGSGSGYKDLVGSKAAGGESALKSRGYSYSWGATEQNAKVNYWWAPGRKNCIQVTTRDGRFDEIVTVGTSVCEN